jgi:hypothetical protein
MRYFQNHEQFLSPKGSPNAREFAMNAIRSFALAAALSLGAALPAPAMTVADLAGAKAPAVAPVSFLFSDQIARGRADATDAAVENYFGFDALITLGALAMSGGGLAALGAYAARRRKRNRAEAESAEPDERDSVFRSMQADLAHFTETLRRAA